MPNKWNLPGGMVEPGEDPQVTAIRECVEEAGIEPHNVRHLTTKQNPTYDVHFFAGETNSPHVKLNYENSDYAWVTRETARQYVYVPQVQEVVLS
jgi:8-oxo-dGTP pyrophosphatase MutT (NUDIX family)